jgi:hypothetical protein
MHSYPGPGEGPSQPALAAVAVAVAVAVGEVVADVVADAVDEGVGSEGAAGGFDVSLHASKTNAKRSEALTGGPKALDRCRARGRSRW